MTSKTSTNLSALGAVIAAVPVIGWTISAILILVSFILAVVSMSKDEPKGGRALLNAILAAPCAVLFGCIGIAVLGNLGS